MLTLAFDTSSSLGSVAVFDGDKTLHSREWERATTHGELLTPAIEDCLAHSGIVPKDLKRIAVGCGPGSFTGARIAINAARSLAYALQIPALSFDTAEILASQERLPVGKPVLAIINAQKNLVYASSFASPAPKGARVLPLTATTLEDLARHILEPHICVGDGFKEYEALFAPDFSPKLLRESSLSDEPTALAIGRLAWMVRAERQPLDWKALQPLYIRASGAEEKIGKGQ
jgi:N6-L-threonylcarbamoyladenine synthase/tRNA threonylcarbamoyladenosine biosynthesis protein TsaB